MKKQSGFTLVEIIIVLLIIGIASGLVGVWISRGSGTLEIRKFTKEVSAALRYARTRSVSEKKIYCFVIDKEEQKYRLYAENTDYTKIDLVSDIPIPEELQMTLRGSDEEAPNVEFFPRGNSSGGVIEILRENGTGYAIVINRITGKVDVEEAE
ncbi:MAG: prepilin-type N-terminal cleavage/methylation domain-containing protein [Nitrospirae bacterium]|nr:prepilin-type N-terminal cleavage/methylation domain-containing protein [Nitrospirota bacterium]